ncbi:MAG: oligosaccharide flippase family protein, partial [Candidatus Paceibacterota bacterium]
FVFTIILARILMPELFGIYGLVLSVVLIAITLADLGINSAVLKYVSESVKKGKKATTRAYLKFLLKIKGLVLAAAILIIVLIARPLAYDIYGKPAIFLPLILSCIYILAVSSYSFFKTVLYAFRDIRKTPLLELVLQGTKIIFAILAILLFAENMKVSGIFLGFAVSAVLALILLFFVLKGRMRLFSGKSEKIERSKVMGYVGFMSLVSISTILFGSIDTLILGRFVGAEYIGYYRAALSLILTISVFLTVSNVLLPVFSQINDKRAKRGFQRIMRYIFIVTVPSTIALIFLSKPIVSILYGADYLPAALPLSILSLLIIPATLIQIYLSLFQSREKVRFLAKTTMLALIMNILFNYLLIRLLSPFGQQYCMIGAAAATILANIIYLWILHARAKKEFGIEFEKTGMIKSLMASAIMAGFILLFNSFAEAGWLAGIIEIIGAAAVYLVFMMLFRGIGKEDIHLIGSLRKI